MTVNDIYTLLTTSKIPVFYHHAPNGQTLPFMTYTIEQSSNFAADDKVYQKITSLSVDLYTKTKDIATEAIIEGVFDSANIPWSKTESYDDDEQFYMETYESEVI